MPKIMRELWPKYATTVRRLCVTAIAKRSSFRPYIRWLESQIAELARAPRREKSTPTQLTLPFFD
jgi:hypothetical protein